MVLNYNYRVIYTPISNYAEIAVCFVCCFVLSFTRFATSKQTLPLAWYHNRVVYVSLLLIVAYIYYINVFYISCLQDSVKNEAFVVGQHIQQKDVQCLLENPTYNRL